MASDYEIYRPADHPSPEGTRSSHASLARGSCAKAGVPNHFVVASTVSVAIWLMTGAGYFWPMWVILGTGVPVLLGVLSGRGGSARQGRSEDPR